MMTRLTFAGALYLSFVCVLPFFLMDQLGISFYLGGMSLLIVVSVGLNTVEQIEAHMITRHYEDFSSKAGTTGTPAGGGGRIKGRDDDI